MQALDLKIRKEYVQEIHLYRASHIKALHQKMSGHIILEKPGIFCKTIYRLAFYIFLNDAFFVYFLISPLNVNLELYTIQHDVGNPVHKRYPQRMRLHRRQYGILWIFLSYIRFPRLYYFLFFSVYPLTTMLNAQDKIQSFRFKEFQVIICAFNIFHYSSISQ